MTTPEQIAEIIRADGKLTEGCKTALCELVAIAYRNLTAGDGGSISLQNTDDRVTLNIDRHDHFSI